MIKLSVIIPLYNKEKYIATTVNSVLQQSFKDFEIVVVNDGSTDISLSIVESISDQRIRLINKQNEGVSATRNRGIQEAKGDYIMFLDADDVLLPNAFSEFERMVSESNGYDILVASFVEKDETGNIVNSCICKNGMMQNPMKSYWEKDCFPRMGNCFIKRQTIQKVGFLRTDFTLYEDLEWIIRLLRSCSVFGSDRVILEYRRYKGGLSFNMPPFEKDFAGSICLTDIKDQYERMVLGDFLIRRILRRGLNGDFLGMMKIVKQNWQQIHTMMRALINRRQF